MKLLLTVDRLRDIVSVAATERDLVKSLRRHKIRYTWTTDPGYLAARVICRSGPVLIYRSASRSAPFVIRSAAAPAVRLPVLSSVYAPLPAPAGYPYPVPRWTWDD